ncbi:MAG TPA: helix-turn-helix transcriptional regulator [Candidatus Brocadiaceae bacterium]|nr:helix-turn-helix transcriptional regulator [Candidatus Brocadiaceae bacterium]
MDGGTNEYPVLGYSGLGYYNRFTMPASLFTKEYERFRKLLEKYRQDNKITQSELAVKLARPQSYISKYENGERRLDVIEFLEIAKVLKINISAFFKELENGETP